MKNENEVLVSEAANLANVSEETVRRWIREGSVSARKLHGLWLIERESLDTFLQGVPN